MQRITVAEAERDFSVLVNRVYSEGIRVELERGNKVIARLPRSTLPRRSGVQFGERGVDRCSSL
jgi:antitoxin (DNA-binding transcriptional repressor) of toxin-antitoxin stability system